MELYEFVKTILAHSIYKNCYEQFIHQFVCRLPVLLYEFAKSF